VGGKTLERDQQLATQTGAPVLGMNPKFLEFAALAPLSTQSAADHLARARLGDAGDALNLVERRRECVGRFETPVDGCCFLWPGVMVRDGDSRHRRVLRLTHG